MSIGKGKRSEAQLSNSIVESTVLAFEELKPQAIRAMKVKDFPLLVINDCFGGELYVKPKLDTAG